MLWAKGNFLFQGLKLAILFLILPSAPAPAPGSLYYNSPAKGSTKTKPTGLSDSPSTHAGLHFRICALKASGHLDFAKTPTISKMAVAGPDLRLSPTVPPAHSLWSRFPELHICQAQRGLFLGTHSVGAGPCWGPVCMGVLGTGREDSAADADIELVPECGVWHGWNGQ